MVTHNLDCLRFTDQVIILEKGNIAAQGHYNHIKNLPIYLEILEKCKKNAKSSMVEEKNNAEFVTRLEAGEKAQDILNPEQSDSDEDQKNDENSKYLLEYKLPLEKKSFIELSIKSKDSMHSNTKSNIKQNNVSKKGGKSNATQESLLSIIGKEVEEPLMLEEDREVGVVDLSVYKSYFSYYGGCFMFLVLFLGKF